MEALRLSVICVVKQYDYDFNAKYYDYLDGSAIPYAAASKSLHKYLKGYGKTVLDVACGTGSFTHEFSRLGYDVVGCDLSRNMMAIAKAKNPKIHFFLQDMRKPIKGNYDIILCMFNAICHLTPEELGKTLKNFSTHSRIVVFDIFNYDYMKNNFITAQFIDKMHKQDNLMIVRFNKNSMDRKHKILNINQHTFVQEGRVMHDSKCSWQMQIYSLDEISTLLDDSGLKLLRIFGKFGKDGLGKFDRKKSSSMIIVAEVK